MATFGETRHREGGQHKTGHIVKGSAWSTKTPGAPFVTSTIPARFEAVPNPTAVESEKKKAFASTAPRFASKTLAPEHMLANPGPGSYSSASSFVTENESFSKKGYGSGFVSKADRFSRANSGRRPGPGPGAYDSPQAAAFPLRAAGSQVAAPPSSAFAPPAAVAPPHAVAVPRRHGPGPGEYSPMKPAPGQGNVAKASFRSGVDRQVEIFRPKDTPAPGDYQYPTGIGSGTGGASSVFRSTTTAHHDHVDRNVGPVLPPPGAPGVDPVTYAKEYLSPELSARAKTGPGPGAYFDPSDRSIAIKDPRKMSSMFSTGSSRFMRRTDATTANYPDLGPATYEPKLPSGTFDDQRAGNGAVSYRPPPHREPSRGGNASARSEPVKQIPGPAVLSHRQVNSTRHIPATVMCFL
eukprot:jgi/Mesvir1/6024/Mv00769-RA.1